MLIEDASKRRQLPAWIREGLEKMERQKQKQQERERGFTEDVQTNQFEGFPQAGHSEEESSLSKSRFVSILHLLAININ